MPTSGGKVKKSKMVKFKGLSDLGVIIRTEQDCIDFFESAIWKGKPVSPFDPTSKVYKCANNQYRCKNTGKYFNIRTNTIFENSKLSLGKWLWAMALFSSHKKGVSSYQLAKYINITQKSAWFVLHRLRLVFKQPGLGTILLENSVEIDETFIGGKNKNRHWNKKVPNSQGRSWKDKVPVLGMLERGGNLITQVVSNTQQNTLEQIIKNNIKKGSNIYTDEWYRHSNLSKSFNHQIVNHSAKEYVNKMAHTNSIENFWSHLKRGVYGTYHWVSKKHLHSYIDEFTLRYNTRKHGEQDRLDLVLSLVVGKRLTYQQLIS